MEMDPQAPSDSHQPAPIVFGRSPSFAHVQQPPAAFSSPLHDKKPAAIVFGRSPTLGVPAPSLYFAGQSPSLVQHRGPLSLDAALDEYYNNEDLQNFEQEDDGQGYPQEHEDEDEEDAFDAAGNSREELLALFGDRSQSEIMQELEPATFFKNPLCWLVVPFLQYIAYIRWQFPSRNKMLRSTGSAIEPLTPFTALPTDIVASGWAFGNKRVLLFDLPGSLDEYVDAVVKHVKQSRDLKKLNSQQLFALSKRQLQGTIFRKIGKLFFTNAETWWFLQSFRDAIVSIFANRAEIAEAITRANESQDRFEEFLANSNPDPAGGTVTAATHAQVMRESSQSMVRLVEVGTEERLENTASHERLMTLAINALTPGGRRQSPLGSDDQESLAPPPSSKRRRVATPRTSNGGDGKSS